MFNLKPSSSPIFKTGFKHSLNIIELVLTANRSISNLRKQYLLLLPEIKKVWMVLTVS